MRVLRDRGGAKRDTRHHAGPPPTGAPSSLNVQSKVMEPPPSGEDGSIGRRVGWPDKQVPAAASSVGGRKVQGFDGGFEGGGGLHVLVGIRVFLDLARQNTG